METNQLQDPMIKIIGKHKVDVQSLPLEYFQNYIIKKPYSQDLTDLVNSRN